MGIFSNLFGADSARFQRARAEKLELKLERLEKKYEDECERHRIREEFLLDSVLRAANQKPIRETAERKADINGFEADFIREQKKQLARAGREAEEAEKAAFVENAVKKGVSIEEAEKYFAEHKAEILNS